MARQLCTAVYLSPLGRITLASEGEQLVGLWFEGQRYYGAGLLPGQAEPCCRSSSSAPLCAARTWLDAYFAGQRPGPLQLALAPGGSPFQQAVWQQLLQIPYDILNRLNRKMLLVSNRTLTTSIKMEDYSVVPVNDKCFDLFYVSTK